MHTHLIIQHSTATLALPGLSAAPFNKRCSFPNSFLSPSLLDLDSPSHSFGHFILLPHCCHPSSFHLPYLTSLHPNHTLLAFPPLPFFFCPLAFSLSDAGCYGLRAAMGLFCLSRHIRLLFRSQSRSGGVERVRGYAVIMCVQYCICV